MAQCLTLFLTDKKKKKKNLLLDPIKKRLLNKKNKAPASTFIKRQQRLKDLLDKQ